MQRESPILNRTNRTTQWIGGRGQAPHVSALAKGLGHGVQGGGVGWQAVHDTRRTMSRDLRKSGVAETTAMRMTAHKSPVMFKRYAVVRDADLPEAAGRLAAYRSTLPTERTVIPLAEVQENGRRTKPAQFGCMTAVRAIGWMGRKSLILKWRRGRDSNPRGLAPIPVFKTGAFNRSATPPVSGFRGLP